MTRAAIILTLSLAAAPLIAEPISIETWRQVMQIAEAQGVPRSIANRMQIEESGDPHTGAWGNPLAIGGVSKEGYRALGLYQIYNKPSNMAWLIQKYWTPFHAVPFDVFNPLHNAELAMRYLSALHRRFGSWERALWYYNCGRVTDVPGKTLGYARRIVEAPEPMAPVGGREKEGRI